MTVPRKTARTPRGSAVAAAAQVQTACCRAAVVQRRALPPALDPRPVQARRSCCVCGWRGHWPLHFQRGGLACPLPLRWAASGGEQRRRERGGGGGEAGAAWYASSSLGGLPAASLIWGVAKRLGPHRAGGGSTWAVAKGVPGCRNNRRREWLSEQAEAFSTQGQNAPAISPSPPLPLV